MSNHTILLIDYEPRSIERFRQPLIAAGYAVEIATDGISGVAAFHRLNPDMVLVEAMIPKKHGFEVCQELKRTPHGRGTPVIITTGVYKGRKYRTQAIHIYGCDEYIEKPIAAEQLLAIVERFLGASKSSVPVPVSTTVGDAVDAPALSRSPERDPSPPSRNTADPGTSRPTPPKTNPVPKALVADLTEEEIMARLDAILPGVAQDAIPADDVISNDRGSMVSPLEVESSSFEGNDPFTQMQAELTAELGSLSTALALEPAPVLEPVAEPMPSDQVVTPSLLEFLPSPESEPEVETIPLARPPVEAAPGQVVNFDAKRSRKAKKNGRKGQTSRVDVSAESPSVPLVAPSVAENAREMSVPSGSLVASALEPPPRTRGIPVWVWAAVGVAALIVYFMFFREGSARTNLPSRAPETSAIHDPLPSSRPEPVDSAAPPPERAATAEETANAALVLNAVGSQPQPPAPARVPPRAPTTSTPPIRADRPAVPPSAADRVAPQHQSAAAPVPAPAQPATDLLEAPPSNPPAGFEAPGAEIVPLPTTAAPEVPKPATALGALVELSEVDTAPVSLSRKLPTYSVQARYRKLQGTVVMKVLVNEQGTVDQVVVVTGVDGADLNEATVKAVRQWTYRPATKDGVPVKVWKSEQVAFKL